MTTAVPFHFVDVFASEPLTGNPLALIPDADGLTDATMRAIAKEFNQSESTFIVQPTLAGATWQLRSFTPIGIEVLGAGHNAMGAWVWLAASGRIGSGQFAQQIGDRVLPVEVHGDTVTMDQSRAEFGGFARDTRELAGALGLDESSLVGPARVVSTGAAHLLVPVRDRDTVDRVIPESSRLLQVLRDAGGEGCYVYSRDPIDPASIAYARFFNPTVGIAEDPATGTAAGPLVALLGESGVIEQGFVLGRPSRLRVTLDDDRVRLSGSGVVVASGTLHL